MPTTDGQPQKSVPDQEKERYEQHRDAAQTCITLAQGAANTTEVQGVLAAGQIHAALAQAAATRILAAEQARANDRWSGALQPAAAEQARCEYVARASGVQCVRKPDGHRVHQGRTEGGNLVTWSYGEHEEQVKAS